MIPEDFKIFYLGLSKNAQVKVVEDLLGLREIEEKLDDPKSTRLDCPRCSSQQIVGYGKNSNGVQRYMCRGCNKTFSSTTGKVWYSLQKKDKLNQYVHCMLSGYTIRESAKCTGISLATSFTWRHKLLTSFKNVSSEHFEDIVESDETYLLFSEKGSKNLKRLARKRGVSASRDGINDDHVAVIVTMDRKGNKAMEVVKRGRITTVDIQKHLQGKIAKGSTLCTDGHPSYAGFTKREGLDHKRIIASKGQRVVEKHYHIQNVNSLDSRLKKFISKFNGVSTKYLQNYLNWFLALEKVKNSTDKFKTLSILAFSSNTTWFECKNIINNQLILIT